MSLVTLVSGGLDSTVMALLAKQEGVKQFPLFINYGQLGLSQEMRACRANLRRHRLPPPKVAALAGYGKLLPSGITDRRKRIYEDAFLPCRNLLFITVGAAYAFQCGAKAVAIGLLDDSNSLFPDQTADFVREAETLVSRSVGRSISVITPLIALSKRGVIEIAGALGIKGTYSCHSGRKAPCGVCVACREFES